MFDPILLALIQLDSGNKMDTPHAMPPKPTDVYDLSQAFEDARRLNLIVETEVSSQLGVDQGSKPKVVAVYGNQDSRHFRVFFSEMSHKRYLRHRRNQLIAGVLISSFLAFQSDKFAAGWHALQTWFTG